MCSENKGILGILAISSWSRWHCGEEKGKQGQIGVLAIEGMCWGGMPKRPDSQSTELWGVVKPCLQCERPGGLGPGSSMTVAQNVLVDLDSAFLFLDCGGSGPEKVKRNRSLSRFAEL